MCGRITLREPRRAIAAFLGREVPELPSPRFNIGPGQEELVIRASATEPGGRELNRLFWGFVPSWSREEKPPPIINARAETIATKPSFREAFRHRRCLVPADGFYEWKRRDRKRLPFLFTLTGDAPFALAAIWETWTHGDTRRDGFCLLTTGPNSLMEPVHDRMPILLDEEGARRWLEAEPTADLTDLLRPFPAERMTARPVSSFVNKIGHEGPQCIEPFEDGEEQLSLF